MKISKLIISFFIFIALLTDAHGIEGDKYSESQRIHDIKSQIASLQQELRELEQSLNLQQYPNNMKMHLSVSQTIDMDDDTIVMSHRPVLEVKEHKYSLCKYSSCQGIACCACTTLTIASMAYLTFGYVAIIKSGGCG